LVGLVGLVLWLVSGLVECLTWYKNLGPPFIGLPENVHSVCITVLDMNDLDRCNTPYFVLFPEFDIFAGRLCHGFMVVEDRPIMSTKYRLPDIFGLN